MGLWFRIHSKRSETAKMATANYNDLDEWDLEQIGELANSPWTKLDNASRGRRTFQRVPAV